MYRLYGTTRGYRFLIRVQRANRDSSIVQLRNIIHGPSHCSYSQNYRPNERYKEVKHSQSAAPSEYPVDEIAGPRRHKRDRSIPNPRPQTQLGSYLPENPFFLHNIEHQAEAASENDTTSVYVDIAGDHGASIPTTTLPRPNHGSRTNSPEGTDLSHQESRSTDRAQHRPCVDPSSPRLEESLVLRPKIDLSYFNVQRWEEASYSEGRVTLPYHESTKFRANTGLRWILGRYTQNVEPLLQQNNLSTQQTYELDRWLLAIFSPENLSALNRRGYDVEDIAAWSWIFGARTSRLSIRRYIHYSRSCRLERQIHQPLFLTLQLLRQNMISAESLDHLISELDLDLQGGAVWDKESATILAIRLLRHARTSDVFSYDRIVDLTLRLLPLTKEGQSADDYGKRLTHFYNRFLSLLALPVARHPFLAVNEQQRAQLKIARAMSDSNMQVSLNREGYRALARVQLMHKKTAEEQQWSRVKAPSWPPWRRDELGIDATLDYPGRDSRVSKVIKHLLEAGYGPESMEHEVQILAGWDTDKSPTIQTRRASKRRPLSWIKNVFHMKQIEPDDVDHHLWAARVAATRSVREAWVCFYAYMQATLTGKRQQRVYHEMFDKLFARTHSTSNGLALPGDGKEVFADPTSPRDMVYVAQEPLSSEELYAQMIQDGIRPTGRLLASLVDHSSTLEGGMNYINASSLGDVKKDVLLHPEKYPEYFIRNVYTNIPDYLLASYLGLLTSRSSSSDVQLLWPGSQSAEERSVRSLSQITPLRYGVTLLQIWKPSYLPAYHAVLEGVYTQAAAGGNGRDLPMQRRHSYTELWQLMKHLLNMLQEQGMRPDLTCFRKVLLLLRNTVIRAPMHFADDTQGFIDAVPLVRSTFVQALRADTCNELISGETSAARIREQPYWKDIEALILVLGFGSDFAGVLEVLRWLQFRQADLDCIGEPGYKEQQLACAARVALETSWSLGIRSGADKSLVAKAKEYVDAWGWPDDIDLEEYMLHHKSWFRGMRAVARAQASAGEARTEQIASK